jgi:hypothetical protein
VSIVNDPARAGQKVIVFSSYLYNQGATDSAGNQTGEAGALLYYRGI